MLAWLSVWSEMQTCIGPSWCHCHSLSLASVQSRLVLPFWYRLTWVVPDKEPLNGCVCMLSVWHLLLLFFLCIVVCCCVWSVSGMCVLPLYFTFYKNLYASTAHLICGWRHLQVVQSISLYLHVYVMCLHKHVQVKTFSNRRATDFLFPAFS